VVQGIEVRVSSWVQGVEIVGDDILVVVQSHAELDERFIANLVPGGQGGWGIHDDGIEVYDRAGQPSFFGWDELGLTDEEVAILTPGSRVLASSDRGETWDTDSVPLGGNILSVASGPGPVAAVVNDLFGPELWLLGEDGWVKGDVALMVGGAASFGGRLYIAGFDEDGAAAVWRSEDGEDWEVVLDGIDDVWLQMSGSSTGLMLWGSGGRFGLSAPIEIEIDGFQVQLFQTGGIRVIDPEIEEVVAELSQERVFNRGGVFVVENADGEPLFELSAQELEMAFTRGGEEFFEGPFGQSISVYMSSDGLAWEKVVVEGSLPPTLAVFSGAPVGDGVALLGWDERGEGQQLWIGTRAG
jgi:hypothetical protein